MHDLGFQTSVERLIAGCLVPATRRHPVTLLLSALGCRTIEIRVDGWRMQVPAQPGAQNESLIVSALEQALRVYVTDGAKNAIGGFSILDGLSTGLRWQQCILTPQGANDFAVLLLALSLAMETTSEHENKMLAIWLPAAGPLIHSATDTWCSHLPATPGIHSTDSLARTLFGDAWCALFSTGDSSSLPLLVRDLKPPFMYGFTPEQTATPHMDLPFISAA
jgi:hypothetical protein